MNRVKAIGIFMAVLLLTTTVLAGCKKATTTTPPQTTTKTAATTTTAATTSAAVTTKPATTAVPTSVAPIVLRFGTATTERGGFGQTLVWWMNEVEKRTNGRVKFERYWSSTLAPATALLGSLTSGVADVTVLQAGNEPASMPLAYFGYLPNMYVDPWPAAKAAADLYKQVPELNAELTKAKARFMFGFAASIQGVMTTKVPIKTLNDMKGLKIRTIGEAAKLVTALGGTAVNITTAEVFTALERGTVDGTVAGPSAALTGGYDGIIKYYYPLPLLGTVLVGAIGESAWNRLPADIQQIIEQVNADYPEANHRIYQVETDVPQLTKMTAAGMQVFNPTAAEIAQSQQVSREKVWVEWVTTTAAKGLPAQKVLDTYLELVKKYEPLSPFKK